MPTEAEYIYWHECWPEALLNILRDFMASGDVPGILGISSLSTCHRQATDVEGAVCTLVRETLGGLEEARKIREDIKNRALELKERGLYDVMEKRATLLESGLIPLKRLEKCVTGYRRRAREIYIELRDAGLLRVEDHALRPKGNHTTWVGLNAKWDRLIEGIKTTGTSNEMFASSLGIMLCMAIEGRGVTTILPMARCVLVAENNGGEISYEELKERYGRGYHRKTKDLNIILERQREKTEPLRIFPTEDRGRLILNRNTAYAVGVWQTEANRLARTRGLGV